MFDLKDDFIGRAVIDLSEAAIVRQSQQSSQAEDDLLNQVPEPKWHAIRPSSHKHMPECG